MKKRVKYVETITKTHYIDLECENEETLNNFIHDSQRLYLTYNPESKNTRIKGLRTDRYSDVNVLKFSRDKDIKSVNCIYADEIIIQ